MDLILFVGLPASGKTTFYQQRFATTHHHVSKDNFPQARDREGRQRQLIAAALTTGQSVVVDNTNPRLLDRAALIAEGRRHGARIVGYFFSSTTRESVARNEQRTGRARVPKVAIFTVAKRLEPPSAEEGFDELYVVRPLPDLTFSVEPAGPLPDSRRPPGSS